MTPSAKEPKKEEMETQQAEGAPKEKSTKKTAKKDNVEKVVELIEKMTFLEVADLVKTMEDRFGVTAAIPAAVAMPAAGGDAAAEAEAQTEFDVHLNAVGDKKIQVIKVVRSILPQLGLKEAKDLVDKSPTVLKEGITDEEANEIKAKLEEVGAQVEVK